MFFVNLTESFDWRYDLAKFVEMNYNVYDVLDSYFLNQLQYLNAGGSVDCLSESRRPDLLAYYAYGRKPSSVQYWWILLAANTEGSASNVLPPKTYAYPSVTDLEDLYFSLNALKNDYNTKKSVTFTKANPISVADQYPPNLNKPSMYNLGTLAEPAAVELPAVIDCGHLE